LLCKKQGLILAVRQTLSSFRHHTLHRQVPFELDTFDFSQENTRVA
jgi:hypothetical protein